VPRSRSIEPGVYRCIVADRTEKPEHPEHRPHLFNRQKPRAELEQLLQEVDGEMVQLDCTSNARFIVPRFGKLDAACLPKGYVAIAPSEEKPRTVLLTDIRWVTTHSGKHGPF